MAFFPVILAMLLVRLPEMTGIINISYEQLQFLGADTFPAALARIGISMLFTFAIARIFSNKVLDFHEMHGDDPRGVFRLAHFYRYLLTLTVLVLFAYHMMVVDWGKYVRNPMEGMGFATGAFYEKVMELSPWWLAKAFALAPFKALLIVINILVCYILILSPFFIMMLLVWAPMHKLDVLLRNSRWKLHKYLSFRMRNDLLILAVPALIFWTMLEGIEYWNPIPLIRDGGYVSFLSTAFSMFTIYLVAPFLLTSIWVTRPLSPSPLRERLEAISRRSGVGFRNILVWDTMGGSMANACVTGFFKSFRYVLVTDTLLETMSDDEIESVFGHELGHVRYHHFAFFFLFILSMIFFGMAMENILGYFFIDMFRGFFPSQSVIVPHVTSIAAWLITLGIYLGGFFGMASRRFERQADVFGAFVVNRTGAFARALQKVAFLNGVDPATPSWRHYSIKKRCEFLDRAASDPNVLRKFEREIKWVMITFALVAVIAMLTIIYFEHAYEIRDRLNGFLAHLRLLRLSGIW